MAAQPPAYPAPAPSHQPSYQSLRGRLTAIKVVFWLMVGISVTTVIIDVVYIVGLNREIAGEDVEDLLLSIEFVAALVALAWTGVFFAAVVVFIMWLYRAYENADAVAPGVRRYGQGWTIGAWFVPILNLFRPKQIVNDVWRAGGHPSEPPGLLAAWWTLWLITNWVANFALRGAFTGNTAEDVRDATVADMVASGIDIPTAILAILVATRITERLDAQASLGPPQPPPQEPVSSAWPPPPPQFGSGDPYPG